MLTRTDRLRQRASQCTASCTSADADAGSSRRRVDGEALQVPDPTLPAGDRVADERVVLDGDAEARRAWWRCGRPRCRRDRGARSRRSCARRRRAPRRGRRRRPRRNVDAVGQRARGGGRAAVIVRSSRCRLSDTSKPAATKPADSLSGIAAVIASRNPSRRSCSRHRSTTRADSGGPPGCGVTQPTRALPCHGPMRARSAPSVTSAVVTGRENTDQRWEWPPTTVDQ